MQKSRGKRGAHRNKPCMIQQLERNFRIYLRTRASNKDSDQPAHSHSLIRIYPERILDSPGCKISSCGQRRLSPVFNRRPCQKVRVFTLQLILVFSLRKHAYSNILKIFPPKDENFQIKNLIFFIFLLKT